jgi:hypothetical protein
VRFFRRPIRRLWNGFRLTRAGRAGNATVRDAENSAAGGIACRPSEVFSKPENPQFIWFFAMARALLVERGPRCAALVEGFAMLLALGAASAAFDAIKSLTAPKPTSSQPVGFGPAGAPWSDDSTAPAGGSAAATGNSGAPQISPDNISALLSAQSQWSGFQAGGTNANSTSPATTVSSAAASTYSAVDQLIPRQSTPALLPTPPISLTV